MFRAIKYLIIILGFGIFIIPNQTLAAQNSSQCCVKMTSKSNCCKKAKTSHCNSENPKKSDTNSCGKDCTTCHSCSMNVVFDVNTAKIDSKFALNEFFQFNFNYRISFFSSDLHNIWQPPKIG